MSDILDRVFPPDQCDFTPGQSKMHLPPDTPEWVAALADNIYGWEGNSMFLAAAGAILEDG